MNKKKDINDLIIEDGVDLKSKKLLKLKNKEKRKIKKRKEAIKEVRKTKVKRTFIGFSGRLSLVFFVIVIVFISNLFLFIYLNNRLELLRIEKAETTIMLLSWEKIINATNQILVKQGKRNKRDTVIAWKQLYKDYEPLILKFIEKGSAKEELENLERIQKIKKGIDLFVDNIMNFILNLIYKQRIILQDTYESNISSNRNAWYLVKSHLIKIENTLESDKIINFIEQVDTSFLVEYGKKIAQKSVDEEFFNAIDTLNAFYAMGQRFAFGLENTINLVDSDINIKSKFINTIMGIIANIISIFAVFFTIVFFFYLRTAILKPLKYLIFETERIGKGDLTGKIQIQRSDEIGTLTTAFNTTVTDLKTLIQQINVAVVVITKTLHTLFKSSLDVKESANAQATTIENTRENFEKLNNMIRTISEETTRANSYTEEALNKTKTGLESISDLEKEMAKIKTSSDEITDIITLINYVAEQTELLSINASIEAARAGESGKGFSVVANEIKQLAERSTQSANRIYELITYNSKIIQNGVNLSRNTANLLREIAMSTEFSASIVKTINDEAKKIQTSSNEILGVINYIAEVAQVNLLEIENISHATADLGEQSVILQRFIGQFDARPQNIKDNQEHIEEILENKLEDVKEIISSYGEEFLPTGNEIEVKSGTNIYFVEELKIGNNIFTYNNDFADSISKRTNTSVSFFQNVKNEFIRVSTTITNYDNTRALGTVIPKESEVYKAVINKESFYGRIFIVNRWYISVYEPIINRTGKIIGVINLAIPEEMEATISEPSKELPKEETLEKEKVLTT